MSVKPSRKLGMGACPLERGSCSLSLYTHTSWWVCSSGAGSRLQQDPFKCPTGTSVFLTANRYSQATGVMGWAVYTTVLREPRLGQPPLGDSSAAGVLPLWEGPGGMSRALLLSAESSRSPREVPEGGRGCSRH